MPFLVTQTLKVMAKKFQSHYIYVIVLKAVVLKMSFRL